MPGRQLLMSFPVTATSHALADYRARGGYATLEKALASMTPQQITAEVTASGLLGHGGAAFAVGRKWSVIRLNDGQPHYLCANADEGEPGTFKDRWILENAPHLLIESMLIASYALQVRNAFVYIRGEFDLPFRRIQGAVDEAYAAGLLGERVLGRDFACDIIVYRGAGSYVCGEASGLITSIEGKRGYPRNRPPRLTVRGLYQRPTVINNVESLANITGIVRDGAEAFRKVGTAKSPGTQLISISGHIAKPGVYEVEYGYPFAKFIHEDCGGVLGGRKLKTIIPGGISTKVLTAAEIEPLKLDHASLAAAGSSMGSGGMIVIAEGTCMVRLLQVLLRFYHHESCGQCTPCREGMGWMHRIIDRIVGGEGRPEDIERLYEISHANDGTTICGMGDAAGYATVGILNKFRDEFEYFIEHKRSRLGGNLEVLPNA
ncbi:MAG: NADH-quinone oxidoreductase subunit NuoF [Betaproteobacteria bacterium]|jgi:NADH-quinone oxidoreductase subunit F|nr:NADH-quinone oxidoreductase subunit NuoF [Betaproteobacteria bacterium]MBK7592092.1 NADH-quinone oxidoreductase subunit NuoF [Betaproteobacteria bacterium]MBK8687642.1 NADH-quinone oxidoreductase subunit NuoF [Betaproteobacteria bacterium]MBL0291883.1 NADH-quinone oxidoreductase subunit NuoF [Betaproteobacteria bacterium]